MPEGKVSLDVDYARGYFAPRFIVGGRNLLPLTFGHALLLTALECPLVPWVGGPVNEVHIAQLSLVCSRDWEKAARAVNGPWSKWWLRLSRWMVMPNRTVHELVVAIAFIRFHFLDAPQTAVVELGDSRKVERSAAPYLSTLAARFIFSGGTRAELMKQPLRILRWESLVEAERDGVIRVREDADDLIERAKAEVLENWRKERRRG